MNTEAQAVIHHLGGTTAVARMIDAPISTVQSWKHIGIPPSRLAHLRLVARDMKKPIPENLGELPPPAPDASTERGEAA